MESQGERGDIPNLKHPTKKIYKIEVGKLSIF